MAKITLNNQTTGYLSSSAINTNNDVIEDHLNNKVLYRNNPTGEPNQMLNDLDMNGFSIINISEGEDDTDLLTVGTGDTRYINTSGDTMTGALHVLTPTASTEPATKGQLDTVASDLATETAGRLALAASVAIADTTHSSGIATNAADIAALDTGLATEETDRIAADDFITSNTLSARQAIIDDYTAIDAAIISSFEAADTDIVTNYEAADETLFSGYTAGDASLQDQMTGVVPLIASAFSEISWHNPSVNNSVTIPADKNAWSWGPEMTIALGQTVTVSSGSTWTLPATDQHDLWVIENNNAYDLSVMSDRLDVVETYTETAPVYLSEEILDIGFQLVGNGVKCVKIGDMVTITGTDVWSMSSNTSPESTDEIIPEAYRPATEIESIYHITTGTKYSMAIHPTGRIELKFYDAVTGAFKANDTTNTRPSITYAI